MNGYSFDDMVAMATSRNVSYGKIQQCLEHGLKLPPLVRSTRWPKSSAHIGEEILPGDVPAAVSVPEMRKKEQERDTSKPKPAKAKLGSGVRLLSCQRCGSPMPSTQSVRIHVHTAKDSCPQGHQFAKICPNCARAVLPEAGPPKKMEREPLYDAAGHKIPIRLVGRCARCGKLHNKADGGQVYVKQAGVDRPALCCYLCRECLPAWKSNCKKSPLTE